MPLQPFNPLLPAVRNDPYPIYRRYREEEPVHSTPPLIPGMPGCWYVFSYDEAVALAKDPRVGRGPMQQLPPSPFAAFFKMLSQWMALRDPPDHTRLREPFNRAFTPRMAVRLELRMAEIAEDLLRRVRGKGSVELMQAFVQPLPALVIAELLGMPREDAHQLRTWSPPLADALSSGQDPGVLKQATRATKDFSKYLRYLIERKRQVPGEDLLSEVAQVEGLSEDELVANCILLLVAGHEAVSLLIGGGLVALLQHPEPLATLRQDPALMPQAVEELIRYTSPTQMSFRVALEVVEIGGQKIKAGEQIALVWGAANRDPAKFAHPDALDLGRDPNPHLGFGHSTHYCLGAGLGRVELRVALTALLALEGLELATEDVQWRKGMFARGPQTLPVTYTG